MQVTDIAAMELAIVLLVGRVTTAASALVLLTALDTVCAVMELVTALMDGGVLIALSALSVQMIVQVMVVARISPVLVMRVGWARIVLLRLV